MSHSPLPAEVPAALYRHPAAAALLNEALTLLGDGVGAAAIEAAAYDAGLKAGPFAILDAMSLDVVDHALHAAMDGHGQGHAHAASDDHGHSHGHDRDHGHGHAHDDHGHAHEHGHGHGHDDGLAHDHTHAHDHDHDHDHAHDHGHDHAHPHAPAAALPSRPLEKSAVYVVEKMAHGYKRAGRAAGGGFYDYTSEPPELWSGLKTFERRSRQLDPADIRDRLLYAACLGALDVATDTPEDTLAQTFGESIATNASQARAQMQRIGADAFLARARDLATRFGARFEPPAAAGPTTA
jgi:hypothetical protein